MISLHYTIMPMIFYLTWIWTLLSLSLISQTYSSKFSMMMMWMTCLLWIIYSWFLTSLNINHWLIQSLGLILIFFFSSTHMWWIMVWFEMSLIPIVFIVLGYGNHSARIPATLYLLVYTLLFSLPTLGLILTMNLSYNYMISDHYISLVAMWIMLMSFLVKLPVFGLHMWLPKTHVESPTIGSCILASVLLKTGSYGIWLTLKWVQTVYSPIWSMMGAMIISIVASIQVDIKKVIALSSISHLNLVLASMVSGSELGYSSFILLALCHGLISSSMFYMAGLSSTSSRLMYYLNKVTLTSWLLVLMFNIGIPPTPSFWSEVMAYMGLMLNHTSWLLFLMLMGLFMTWFSISIYLVLKTQPLVMSNGNSLMVMWSFLIILIFWINPSMGM